MNTPTAVPDPPSLHSRGSVPDEDPQDAVVTDSDVLAEVKLPTRPSEFSTPELVLWLLIIDT